MNPTNDIQRTLQLFSVDDGLIEIRALHCWKGNPEFKSTQSGYFDNGHLIEAEKAAIWLETRLHAGGVYLLLNPAKPDLLARSKNRIKKADRGGTTKDDEIVYRRWLLIDFDPMRPAGVSSTDAEIAIAGEQAKECGRWLCDNGWPLPVIAMSGNGWHLLYRVDLPADDKSIEACLKSLAAKFPLVDASNFNAARITKCYGSIARKGDSTPDRPHRRSRLVDVPERIDVVATDCIEWLAIQSTKVTTAHTTRSNIGSDTVDIPLYLRNRSIPVLNEGNWDGSKRWFIQCPGIASHTTENAETDCSIWQDSVGVIHAKCFHNSCGIKSWADIRDALGKLNSADFPSPPNNVGLSGIIGKPNGGYRFPEGALVKCGDHGNVGTVVCDDGGPIVTVHFVSPEGNEVTSDLKREHVRFALGDSPKSITIGTAREIIRDFPTLRPPIIDGLIRRGETMNIIAAPKTGKSWLSMCLALAVVSGQKWLGRFWTRRGKVLIIDNELHPETSAHRLPKIAGAMRVPTEDYADHLLITSLRGELLDMQQLALQLNGLKPDEISVIILDAWYRFQPKGSDENSNADVAAIYNLLDAVSARIGCAFVCIHHSSKGNQGSKGVTDVGSGAGAQSRAPDAHLVMRQHETDGVVIVDAAIRSFAPMDSFCLRWQFPIWESADDLDPTALKQERPRKTAKPVDDSKPSKDEQRKQRDDENLEKILATYRTFPNGETESILAETAGLNMKYFRPINAKLIRDGRVVPADVQKSRKKPYPGFKLIDSKSTPTLRHSDKKRVQSDVSDYDNTHTPTSALSL